MKSQDTKITMITEVKEMTKKTEVITFRTDSETKDLLNKIAKEKEWSIAQVVDKICKEYFKNNSDNSQIINQITINNHNGNQN